MFANLGFDWGEATDGSCVCVWVEVGDANIAQATHLINVRVNKGNRKSLRGIPSLDAFGIPQTSLNH